MVAKKRTCPICGKEFTPNGRQKYCVEECAYTADVTRSRDNRALIRQREKIKKNRNPHVLEDTIREMNKEGLTASDYATYQKNKTLAIVGGVLTKGV